MFMGENVNYHSLPIETIHDMWSEPRPWRRPGWKGHSFVEVKPGAILNEVDGPNGDVSGYGPKK